jgi:16S rRNA (guanine966-N2)-methyltransferase
VETDRAALDILRRNAAALGAGDRADVRPQDATRVAGGPYHLVLIDPPYGSGLGAKAIASLMAAGALAPGALISIEAARGESVEIAGLQTETERTYGKARLTLLRA